MNDMSSAIYSSHTDSTYLYWWARPSRIVFFLHIPVFLLCGALDDSAFALYKQNNQFFAGTVLLYGLLALTAFALASAYFEPNTARLTADTLVPAAAVNRALNVLIALVLAAYAIFMYPLLLKPQLVIDVVLGSPTAMYSLRESLNRVPGVTSLVSLGSLIAGIVILYGPLTGQPLPRRYIMLTGLVAFACLMRAWLWSERLAVIEMGLATVIALLAKAAPTGKKTGVRPLTFAPVAGVVALVLIFGIGEYFRSWQFYRNVFPGSYSEFALIRLAGYYATALNNGAALVTLNEPLYFPTFTIEWFYRLPLWSLLGTTPEIGSFDFSDWMMFLEAYLNPEFNNSSGIYMPLFDFGTFLGIVLWGALGALSGFLCRAFALGELPGMIIYPVWFAGVVEMLRVFYWGDQRFFPVIVAAVIIVRYFRGAAVPFQSQMREA